MGAGLASRRAATMRAMLGDERRGPGGDDQKRYGRARMPAHLVGEKFREEQGEVPLGPFLGHSQIGQLVTLVDQRDPFLLEFRRGGRWPPRSGAAKTPAGPGE